MHVSQELATDVLTPKERWGLQLCVPQRGVPRAAVASGSELTLAHPQVCKCACGAVHKCRDVMATHTACPEAPVCYLVPPKIGGSVPRMSLAKRRWSR